MSVAEIVASFPEPVRHTGSPLSVLIVDDDRKMRERLIAQFDVFGLVPEVAASGFTAIQLAAASRPQLILLDALLPEMHGFEVARFIRNIDRDYHPHIVVITAIYKSVRYHNEARLKYGINDYLLKPASDTALFSIVSKVRQQVAR